MRAGRGPGAEERVDAGRACGRGMPGRDAAAAAPGGLDVDGVRDDVRAYVIEQLGDKDGVLIAGAHGPRECHWARLPVRNGWKRGRGHWLLARRSLSDPEEIAYYACYGPRWSSTAGLAWTAGSRWHIEECIQQATGEAGLDHYQSAPGGPGMPTSPCPCSPWPGSRPPGPRRERGHRHQRPRHDRLHAPGDPPPAEQLDPGLRTRPRRRPVLVPLAPTTPVPGPALPLPATRLPADLS